MSASDHQPTQPADLVAELSLEIAERRRAEERLRESEALYRSVLNASPDDITVADLDGRIIMVSPRAVSMFGYERAEQGLGRHVTEFLVPEDRARAATRVALMFQGTPPGPNEYRGLRRDGSTFDLEVHTGIVPGPDGRPRGFVVIARDVTARKQAEAALRQANDQIKTLRGLLPICMHCKKIRDGQGAWSPVEVYVRARTEAEFSHGLCPECAERYHPGSDDEPAGG